MPGIHGLDLLSYRISSDVKQLTRLVVYAVSIPMLAAGSINRPERVRALCDANVRTADPSVCLSDRIGMLRMDPIHVI